MTDVVWAEESKNGIKFEIGTSYDNVPTMSQLGNPAVAYFWQNMRARFIFGTMCDRIAPCAYVP